jgi:sugar lactone lactonase YvrE
VDKDGNIYIADTENYNIRKISISGNITILAGSGSEQHGWRDGTGLYAEFNSPMGVAVDKNGNVYVADYNNHKIRKITPSGVVTTLAGNGGSGSVDGPANVATFYWPMGVALDDSGNVYVADSGSNKIRKITIPQ